MRPRIVALIGSSRFKDRFHAEGFRLEKQGIVALMMGCFQHADRLVMTPEEFERVHSTDIARIDLADEVLVINPRTPVCNDCGRPVEYEPKWGGQWCPACYTRQYDCREVAYIGDSTRLEIEYVRQQGKPVVGLEPLE